MIADFKKAILCGKVLSITIMLLSTMILEQLYSYGL